jgi:hypothetical protein
MTKTRTTYVVMILIFTVGLWAILRAGNHLHAARNVAGEWQVKWAQPGSQQPERLTLSQSGRFLNATLHEQDKSAGVQLSGRLEGEGSESGRKLVLHAAKSDLTLNAILDDTGQVLAGSVEAGAPAGWQATRIHPPTAAH